MITFLTIFVRFFLIALWLVILGRVIYSWLNPTLSGTIGRFLFDVTEPLLAPIRRLLPQTGALDLSPLVLLVVLGVVMRLVITI